MTPIEQYNATAQMRWQAAVAWCRNHPLNGLYVPFGRSDLLVAPGQYLPLVPGGGYSKIVTYNGVKISIGYSTVYQGPEPGYHFSIYPIDEPHNGPTPHKAFPARNPIEMDQQAVRDGKQMMMSFQGARPPSLPRGALIPQGQYWPVPQSVPPRKPKLQDGLDEGKKPGDATETVVQLVERRQRETELQEFLKQYELEQRKKEAALLEDRPVEFAAIIADAPPPEPKTPVESRREEAPASTKDVGRLDHGTSEPAETPSLSAARPAGLPVYAKFGLGILVAVLGILALAYGIWYFGRGVYDNLEYR